MGVCQIDLFIGESRSLKGKRQVLRKILDRAKSKFNVSIAEVGDHELWQRAEVGFCVVGNDRRFVDSALSKILSFIEQLHVAEITRAETEILHFNF